jgi:chromosome segregation ATPase
MEDMISRKEHEEFSRRIDEENSRQNHRIEELEESVRQISELTATIRELAVNMKNMMEEQTRQGKRLEVIESRDGEKWRTVVSYVITAVVGAVAAYFLARFGM